VPDRRLAEAADLTVNGTMFLLILCGAGGLVGAALGHRIHRSAAGLLLGTFLPLLGWVMILEARPRLSVRDGSLADRE
jgi:uncharacterized membrane protein YfcA